MSETNTPQHHNLIRGLRLILCLSLIGSTIALIYNVSMSAMLPHYTAAYHDGSLHINGMLKVAFEDSLNIPRHCYILDALLSLGSIIGICMMWALRPNGYLFYASSQLLTILVAILLMGRANTQVGNIMMTALFLTYYAIAMSRLGTTPKRKKQEISDTPTENIKQ